MKVFNILDYGANFCYALQTASIQKDMMIAFWPAAAK